MIRMKNLGRIAVALGVVAVPMGIASAAPASADPGWCVSGPFGYAHACVDGPGWYGGWYNDWYDGPGWGGGWRPGNDD